MHKIDICIVAGEASGDLLGAKFISNFNRLAKTNQVSPCFFGFGGDEMRRVCDVRHYEKIQIAGVSGLFPKIFDLVKNFNVLKKQIKERKPNLVVLIDFPDFNLHLAKFAKSLDIPVLYYAAPQLWAWREGRIKQIRDNVTKLAVLFPFEEKWFKNRGIPATYVIHPKLGSIKFQPQNAEKSRYKVALLPGSRTHEIEHIFPIQLKTVKLLLDFLPDFFEFCVVPAQGKYQLINKIMKLSNTNLPCVENKNNIDLALVAAGTATFELALMGVPFVVIHKLGRVNFEIAKRLVKTKFIAMPNILLDQMIAPEFIQNDCNPQKIAHCVSELLSDPQNLAKMQSNWQLMRENMEQYQSISSIEEIAFDMIKI